MMNHAHQEKLKTYFNQEPSVILAFWHGSSSKGKATDESDIDLAVYLKTPEQEDRIWRAVTNILGEEIDLLVMNEAPATIISSIFKTGQPLVIKNRRLYGNLYLEKTFEAEEFAKFATDYWNIYQRSRSLVPEDKTRLVERLQFLEQELADIGQFKNIDYQQYRDNRSKRREIERWAENIINATIDCAKIILASQKSTMPKTYEEALHAFGIQAGLSTEQAQRLATFARLRNLLAHEYLDLLYDRLQKFITEFPEIYQKMSPFLKEHIEKSEQ